ncbi:Maf family protein [Candidatus Chlorohelix allophototropha]|uniref:dTTP/UTP pyrophosphatase n=1 Tax=Candidatus Chlorohelix allophototropha TaxID=3003348 RepID=A0ABY9B9R0_9CHLR|nr:Maf family protein [Chloroflexota bacterium L227-S17]
MTGKYPEINIFDKVQVILASGSPRRRELLSRLLPADNFHIIVSEVDEALHQDEDYLDYVKRLALSKAIAGGKLWFEKNEEAGRDILVIGADTIVVLDNVVFGKPRDAAQAGNFLESLSGRTHLVITGFAVITMNRQKGIERQEVSHTVSEVEFRNISAAEINWYVATGEPADKAGAYAIQGYGGALIAAVRGDYYNVVGLPLGPLIEQLRKF